MLRISRMASNLRVDELGSSSAVVSWDSESNGTVYTLHLQDSDENTLTSFETEETSVTFEDLTQGTNYVFKLYAVQSPTVEAYTKIRIDHPHDYWLNIQEVEVYALANDTLMDSTNFNMNASPTYSLAVETQAMNRKISTGQGWLEGAMLDYRYTSLLFWEASFSPTQLSRVRLCTHASYKLNTGSTLTMTKENGEEVVYNLMDTEHWVDNVQTTQEISFAEPEDR